MRRNFNWFKKGISSSLDFSFEKIPNPGDPKFLNLPEKLKNILRLDKPDLIISKKSNKNINLSNFSNFKKLENELIKNKYEIK